MEVRAGYKQTEVGVIPEDWSLKGLGDISDLDIGLSKPNIVFGSGCPVVTVQDLYGGAIVDVSSLKRVVVTADEIQRYKLQKDDILIGNASVKRDGIGYANRFDGAIEDVIFAKYAYRAKSIRSVLPLFLHHVLRASFCRQWIISNSQTGTLTNLNKAAARAIPITVPSTFEEQRAIAEALSDADALIESLKQLLAKKRHLKQGTMQELLTGKRRLPGFSGEWRQQPLGEIAEVVMGQSPSSVFYNRTGDGLPLIQGNADVMNRKTVARVFTTQVTKRGRRGDILLSVRAPVGEVCTAAFDVALGRGVCAVRYSNGFMYHALIAKEPEWARLSKGSTFDSVTSTDVREFLIVIPMDESEQVAIAVVLNDLDTELAALDERLTKARHIKLGMMQNLLTGRIRLA